MKTIFRFFGLAILVTVFTVAGGMSVFAQGTPAAPAAPTPCDNVEVREALEQKVRDNYVKDRKTAVAAGEEYIKTYSSCEAQPIKDFIAYLNGYIPATKKALQAEADLEADKLRVAKFDNGIKNSNWEDAYSAGKELVAKNPDNINVLIALGSIGRVEVGKTPRNNKYNDDSVRFAKMAIQKINEGKTSKNFGTYQLSYLNKENALGWLNYSVGYVMFFGQNNRKDALPFLYEATKHETTKSLPQVFGILGDYYFDEVKRLGDEVKVKTEAAGNKDTDETKALVAQLKAYAERSIDAYGRARKLVNLTADPKMKGYYDGLTSAINTMYTVRFQKTEGVNEFLVSQVAKPLPDPTTVPTPIVEVDPADVPAPGTPAPGTKPVTTPAPGTAKPAVTPSNGTKPAVTPSNSTKPPTTTPSTTRKPVSVNGSGTSTTTAAAKPAAKKPVVKKKGTR